MIKFENTEVVGWEAAIRGMRNPMNSWEMSDSFKCPDGACYCEKCSYYVPFCDRNDNYETCDRTGEFIIGPNDFALMKKLRNAGTDHRKFMRMITVYVDITAPLYWWKEFCTYRAGVKPGDWEGDTMDIEMNSCSTMHKIAAKEFTLDDFSHEHLDKEVFCTSYNGEAFYESPYENLRCTLAMLNTMRDCYVLTGDKHYWWQMIQLLPSSYNQRRTVMLNYEVLANIYKSRKNHKLDCWRIGFMEWIESLPYSELITGEKL